MRGDSIILEVFITLKKSKNIEVKINIKKVIINYNTEVFFKRILLFIDMLFPTPNYPHIPTYSYSYYYNYNILKQ